MLVQNVHPSKTEAISHECLPILNCSYSSLFNRKSYVIYDLAMHPIPSNSTNMREKSRVLFSFNLLEFIRRFNLELQ